MKWKWELLIKSCTGCGICYDVCPEKAIKMDRVMPYPEPIEGQCTGCFTCMNECPFEAIKVSQI